MSFTSVSAFTFNIIQSNTFAMAVFHSLRMIFSNIALVLAYLGWIMPAWLEKWIRGKAWIVKQYEKRQ